MDAALQVGRKRHRTGAYRGRQTQERSGPSSAIVRTHPLCAYPLVAHYKGSGDTGDAANFVCGKPE